MLKIASESAALSSGKSDGDFQSAETTMPERTPMSFLSKKTLKKSLP